MFPLQLELTGSVCGMINGSRYVLSNLRVRRRPALRGVVLVKPYAGFICSKNCSSDCDMASETVGLIFDPNVIFVGGSCIHISHHHLKADERPDCYHYGNLDLSHRYLDCIVEDVFEGVPPTEVSPGQKLEYRDMILYMLEARAFALGEHGQTGSGQSGLSE